MDTTHAILAFTVAAGLLTMTPGLDTALVVRTSAVEGWRRGMQVSFGISLGCLAWAVAAAIGLGALLEASQIAYNILRVVGALYMLWLGTGMVIAGLIKPQAAVASSDKVEPVTRSWQLQGFLTNILNPKVGVFYVSFLPLFIPAHVNVTAFSMLLACIHVSEGTLWFLLLTTLMRPMANWIQGANVKRTFDGITGSVLIAFGAGLFLERR